MYHKKGLKKPPYKMWIKILPYRATQTLDFQLSTEMLIMNFFIIKAIKNTKLILINCFLVLSGGIK